MFGPVRWPPEAWVPLASGLAWNLVAVSAGLAWGVPALLPGTFLLASGTGMLLLPGDRRLSHFAAKSPLFQRYPALGSDACDPRPL